MGFVTLKKQKENNNKQQHHHHHLLAVSCYKTFLSRWCRYPRTSFIMSSVSPLNGCISNHSNTFKWGVVHSRVFTQTVLLAWTDQPRHLSLKPLETNNHHRGQTTRADVSANRQNVTHQVTISLIYILCMYTHSGWCSDVPREAKVTQQNIYTHTSHCGSLQ